MEEIIQSNSGRDETSARIAATGHLGAQKVIAQLPWSWCASVIVAVPAQVAFRFMADGRKQSNWAMFSWNRRHVAGDLFVGTSLFDEKELYVKLVAREELSLVDYYCGASADSLSWQVEARVIPGDAIGLGRDKSLINMTTWRTATTDAVGWELMGHVWQTEIHLIKGLIEREDRA